MHPREVIEAALAHRLKDKAEAAYARGDLFVKRRRLMEDWAEFLAKAPGGSCGDAGDRRRGMRMTNRTSMFTILPPNDLDPVLIRRADVTTAMVKQRLREYLPELLEPLGHNDGEALADEIVLLAGVYLAANGRSTVANRKARVAAMLKAMQQAEKAFDVVNAT